MSRCVKLRFVLLAALAALPVTSAAAIYVKHDSPGPTFDGTSWATAYHSVQQAISAASPSGEVWVAAGVYTECITMRIGVTLMGGFAGTETSRDQRDWKLNVTVLDGGGTGSVVTFTSGQPANTRIDGFTIRGGAALKGSGVCCANIGTSPTITNNTLTQNRSSDGSSYGGGIYCGECSAAQISHNTFCDNRAEYGGAICSDGASPTIYHNVIVRNSAFDGAGVCCRTGGTPAILSNVIRENSASEGGGVFCIDATATIANNQLTANGAYRGAGILCWNSSATKMVNNTLTGNNAFQGGGIYVMICSPAVTNNLIAFNSSGICRDVRFAGTPIAQYNCVYGNGYNYGGTTDVTGTLGNISADPMLAGAPYGDCHIQPGSPCIDAGSELALDSEWCDVDLQARKIGAHVDIGADESVGTAFTISPAIVRISPEGSDDNDGSSWDRAKRSIQAGLDAVYPQGGEVWVRGGVYQECVTLRPYTSLYGGFAGNETDRSQRDRRANETVIDARLLGSAVTVGQAGYLLAEVNGFTIRNGKGTGQDASNSLAGGGIDCAFADYHASFIRVTDNTITGNVGYGIYFAQASGGIITGNDIVDNQGYGIEFRWAAPVISDNRIARNLYEGIDFWASGPRGDQYYGLPPIITDNTITANGRSGIRGSESVADIERNLITANKNSGVICGSTSDRACATIVNNRIRGNGGDGVSCGGPQSVVSGNEVVANSGAGISCSSSATVSNNTVVGNYRGIDFTSIDHPVVSNNIVAFNATGLYAGSSATRMLHRNCVYGNGTNYYGVAIGATDIRQDPKLAWPLQGNVHIQPGSPCIDSGNDSYIRTDRDIDGQPRKQGSAVDIGADESDGTEWPVVAPNVFRVSPSGDDANDGSSWENAKLTVQAAIDAASVDSGEVWVAAGRYREQLRILPLVTLYGGFSGTETSRSERDWAANAAILDGQDMGVVLTTASGLPTTVDGFTITGGDGGAIIASGLITIANNTITANRAEANGVVVCNNGATLTNNVIVGNGGGINCGAGAVISGNTVAGNCSSRKGSAIYCQGTATVTNNIIAFNAAGVYGRTPGALTLRGNCTYQNASYNYLGLADPTGSNGNVSADPRLAGLSFGDIHIQPDSPCVDAGDDASSTSVCDADHQARVQGARVDIGADESDGSTRTVTRAIVRVASDGDDGNDGSAWEKAKKTVQAGIDAVSVGGGEVWVKAGTYSECITVPNFVYLYGGFAGTETERSGRNWEANTTVLDGHQAGSVVTATSGHRISTIDGFTITNGSDAATSTRNNGGGLYCHCSGPLIANNTITRNVVSDNGGGACFLLSSAFLLNNTISANEAHYGGGVYCDYSITEMSGNAITDNKAVSYAGLGCTNVASLTLTNNTIARNSARSAIGGIYISGDASGPVLVENNELSDNTTGTAAGIVCEYSGAGAEWMVRSNRITNNTATGNYGGAYASGSVTLAGNTVTGNAARTGGGATVQGAASLINNLIADNTATQTGGGVLTCSLCTGVPQVLNNTIVHNTAPDGGGISVRYSGTFANNVVAFNSSGGLRWEYPSSSLPSMLDNCVYGNTGYDYKDFSTDPTGTNGNISMDPQLSNAATGDYRLLPGSPCIDAGDSASAPEDDLLGKPRPIDGNSDGLAAPDIGCYEFALANMTTITGAKTAEDGSPVGVAGQVTTGVFADRFYVESPNRATGIGVIGACTGMGRFVAVEGAVRTIDGERVIVAASVSEGASAPVPAPWYLTGDSLGGGGLGMQAAVQDYRPVKDPATGRWERKLVARGGANNVGLLVKMTGRVTSAQAGSFYLDGTVAFDDGDPATKGVKVDWPFEAGSMPADGAFIEVVGVSSCTVREGIVVRLLRPLSADAVRVLR